MRLKQMSMLLILTWSCLACAQTPTTTPQPVLEPGIFGQTEADGYWDYFVEPFNNRNNFGTTRFKAEAGSDTKFSGQWFDNTFGDSTITGDLETGILRLVHSRREFEVDVTGKYKNGVFTGTYKANYSNRERSAGRMTLTKGAPAADLVVSLLGPKQARVSIWQNGRQIAEKRINGSDVFMRLPRAPLIVRADNADWYSLPNEQAVDLTSGNGLAKLQFTAEPFGTSLATALEVSNGATSTLEVTLTAAPGFSGSVQLELSNLPNGVTQVSLPSVTLGSSPVTVGLPVQAAVNTVSRDAVATLTARSSGVEVRQAVVVRTRPASSLPVPEDNSNVVFSPDGSAYFLSGTPKTFNRIAPNGQSEPMHPALPAGYPDMQVAPDGSLWIGCKEPKLIRVDPVSKASESFTNTVGCDYFADGQKRLWTQVAGLGLRRTDPSNGQVKEINDPGLAATIPGLRLFGDKIWQLRGGLTSVDTETLEVQRYELPAFNFGVFFVRGSTVYLSSSTGLYLYDLNLGTLSTHTPATEQPVRLFGVDAQGMVWLASKDRWLLYNPASRQVLRELAGMPTFEYWYEWYGSVRPDGGLWYFKYQRSAQLRLVQP
jgi:streptogramin lyase